MLKQKLMIMAVCLLPIVNAENNVKLLFDKENLGSWQSVNDDVMGGISSGNSYITENKTLKFSGRLSLKNNGGFASIRSAKSQYNLGQFDFLAFRVRGDGRQYYVNLHTNIYIPGGSYWAKLPTVAGEWTEIRIAFTEFAATSFGRQVPFFPKLNPAKIKQIGFMIADKKEGDFDLEIDWIKAETKSASGDEKDIVDIALATRELTTMVAVLKAAGMVDTLKQKGDFTVFAPDNEAFAKISQEMLTSLAQPENKAKLVAILSHHVVPGRLFTPKSKVTTLQGDAVTISSDAYKTIETAIDRGVPLFNNGYPDKCSSIYRTAVKDLLAMKEVYSDPELRHRLQKALVQVKQNTSSRKNAWILRYALDETYSALKDK